jgi:hypothetical protein
MSQAYRLNRPPQQYLCGAFSVACGKRGDGGV